MSIIQVGFGREDYTPRGETRLNSVKITSEVRAPIQVSCTAISDSETTVLLFSNDLRGSGAQITKPMREQVSAATGIPADHIMISATHNHTAPDINYDEDERIRTWMDEIALPAVVRAAKAALADLSPCTLQQGRQTVEKVAYTRRYFREDGAFHGIHVIKTSDAPIARHETEADPELRLLRFCREGKRDVLLLNFQVHAATAGSNKIPFVSADFIHNLRNEVEAEEEVLVMYLQGGCGNSNTYSRVDPEAPNDDYDLAGSRLAAGTLAALKKGLTPVADGKLSLLWGSYEATVNHEKSHLAPLALELFRKINREGLTTEQEKRAVFQAHGIASRYEAAAIRRRSMLGKTDSIPLAAISFGEVGMVFTPGEFFDEPFRQLRAASPFEMTFTVGYSNGGKGYIPSAYGFSNGGYETLQCYYIAGTAECCCLEAARMLRDLKKKG